MSLRRGCKLIVCVGFLICFSCIGILYGNLSSSAAESQDMLNIKNRAIEQLKKEVEDRDTKKFTLENKILTLEREASQCSEYKNKAVEKSDALQRSFDDLRDKAAEVESNLRKLEQSSSDQLEAHDEDLRANLDTLEELRADLKRHKESTESCVDDLSSLKGYVKQVESKLESGKNELEKCLQGSSKADKELKQLDSDREDVEQHQVQAPVPPEVPKPQHIVDSADHNAPAPVPVPAQGRVVGGDLQEDQIAALPNAVKLPKIIDINEGQPQLVGAAPPPLQPAPQAQDPQLAPLPALPQELQPPPQHP